MKNAGITILALIGGLIGGFVLFELIVRFGLRMFDSVPIVFIGILSTLMPAAGAIIALLLVQRRRRSGK
ncbi:DUF5957 family protein [Paenibacillus mendelii]|uniref:DUF5957 family protein n=1 Tax=Paenibacillus mendelii TaxID=206163 RepID=A0ABV6JCH2_9BACL|nr:DUF5957 family protein [Paenibacillus mendelii]MCQ6561592.1 DUF5957 family protein [Paenibacillus mendelii]